MTKYHLKYWAKRSGSTSNPLIPALSISRVYVNADDGSTLGYVERRIQEGERSGRSSYDRHRAAKGDTTVTQSDVITSTLPEGVLEKILAGIVAFSPDYAEAMRGDMDRWLALQGHARGVNWIASGAQKRRLTRQARFEIEL